MNELMRNAGGSYGMFDELARIQDDFNRLFDVRSGTNYPPINAWQSADDIVIEAELPGVNPDDVVISVQNNTLTLSGERRTEKPAGDDIVTYIKERPEGGFSRSLQLPYRIESDKVTANYRNGVLRIVLPRAEDDKPRKISVSAE